MKPETRFKMQVLRDLKTLGEKIWWVKTEAGARRGIPDILICLNGLFIAIELKRPMTEKRQLHYEPLQQFTLAKIKKAGGQAFTATPYNWQEIFATLVYLNKTGG